MYEIPLKNTKWLCPKCGKKGEIAESKDAMMVLRNQVREAHGNSKSCPFDIHKILVSMTPEEVAFETSVLKEPEKNSYLGHYTSLGSKDSLSWMTDAPKRREIILQMLKKRSPRSTYSIRNSFGRYGDYGDIQRLISENKITLAKHHTIEVVSLA